MKRSDTINSLPLHERPGFLDSMYTKARQNPEDIENATAVVETLQKTQVHPRYDFSSHREKLLDQISRAVREKYGFNKVYRLAKTEQYTGQADRVILVWSEHQILPAEQYRKAWYLDETTDIVVCQDPNVQKAQLGEKAIIYHFS